MSSTWDSVRNTEKETACKENTEAGSSNPIIISISKQWNARYIVMDGGNIFYLSCRGCFHGVVSVRSWIIRYWYNPLCRQIIEGQWLGCMNHCIIDYCGNGKNKFLTKAALALKMLSFTNTKISMTKTWRK